MRNIHWRPESLDDYIGQEPLKRWLKQELTASKLQNRAMGNMLLYGPPGLGKTTLVRLLSHERGVRYIELLGPTVTEAVLASALGAYDNHPKHEMVDDTGWTRVDRIEDDEQIIIFEKDPMEPTLPSILVIDEIEAMKTHLFEMLHHALEPDGHGDRYYFHRPAGMRQALKYWVPDFTLVGVTNFEHEVPDAFKRSGRCKMRYEFQPYSITESCRVVERFASACRIDIHQDAARIIAERANGSPATVKDYLVEALNRADVVGDKQVRVEHVEVALDLIGVDVLGLNQAHRDYLKLLCESVNGKMALATLASALNKDTKTLTRSVEPLLIRQRLIEVVPGGRQVTASGRRHIGSVTPEDSSVKFSRAIR